MPELPEVETVRRGLEKLILGKTIQSVEVKYPKMIQTDLDAFRQDLPGQEIRAMGRRGKYLLFYLTDLVLISHLRMEGKYFFYPDEVPLRKHAHVFFHFTDGSTLVYEDVRKFGTMEVLVPELVDSYFLAKKIGPEPTEADFKAPAFQAALKKSKKPIKSALLDQKLVAGLGNIYVDEVLYRAKVHPARLGQSLTAREAKAIRKETIAVLAQAVEKGGLPFALIPMLLEKMAPCRKNTRSMGKPASLVCAAGLRLRKSSWGDAEPIFAPTVKRRTRW